MSGSTNNNTLQIPTASTSQPPPPQPTLPTVTLPTIEVPKVELDSNKKEKTMAEFLAMMDNYAPVVNIINFSLFKKLSLTSFIENRYLML
jgi:hypothetical protein